MTFTATGSLRSANTAALTLASQGTGNLLVAEVLNFSGNAVWCTGLSGTGATWVQAGVKFSGSTHNWSAAVFLGTVTAPGAGTAAPAWSGTTPTSYEIDALEFTTSSGAWAFDVQGNLDVAGTSNWPSLTPAGAGELYFGLMEDSATVVAGSTPGYVYLVSPAHGNAVAFNAACGVGATFPSWTDAGTQFGIVVLVVEVGQVIAGLASGAGTAQTAPGPALLTSPSFAVNFAIIAGGTGAWANPGSAEGPPDAGGPRVSVPGIARPGKAVPGDPGIVANTTWTAP